MDGDLFREMKIRVADKKDFNAIMELNKNSVPEVSDISMSELSHLFEMASRFIVIESEDEIAGFMITLEKGQNYESLNYRFFNNHYSDFEYVDRIVIAEKYRGKGYGTAFYNKLFEDSDAKVVTCEVNVKPPNPVSMNFHHNMGFNEISKIVSENGKKLVSLLVKNLK